MARSVNYPLDVTSRFTLAEYNGFAQGIAPVGNIVGVIHNGEGDLYSYVVFNAVRQAWQRIYVTEAYVDQIDLNVVSIEQETAGLKLALADLQTRVQSLQQTCESLAASVAQVSGFLGVVIPSWINKTEVEHGDDMGLSRPSAADLGLVVTFVESRQVPGFGQDDVVAIDPPAGTFVARGTAVTVTLDIEG